MTTFLRHYRAVAADTYQPPGEVPAAEGLHLTELAERDLRARLAAGERPRVALVAPERALLEDHDQHGNLTRQVWAWTRESDWLTEWLHAPHVLAEVSADHDEPDPACEKFAAHGSRRLTGARLLRLHVSPFLAPVADQLAHDTGAEVVVLTGPDTPPPQAPVLPATVVPGMLDPGTCSWLWQHYLDSTEEAPPLLPCDAVSAPTEAVAALMPYLSMYAAALGLGLDEVRGQLMNYEPGQGFREHTDATGDLAKTLDRTVSASVILNRPGLDYDGGDLYVDGRLIEAEQGDAVVFTAATPHRVTPVTDGQRFVLVLFGEVIR